MTSYPVAIRTKKLQEKENMEAAKEEEEESIAQTSNENAASARKKHNLLKWKKGKRKKNGPSNTREILLENFENEAMKFHQKTNEHAQRKGQDLSVKTIHVNPSQSSLAKPAERDLGLIKLDNEEKGKEKIDMTKMTEMWAALENELRTPRTAVACTNLAKNTGLKNAFGKRRSRKFKNIKAARAFRAACRRRRRHGDSSPFPSSDSGNEDEEIFSINYPPSSTVQPHNQDGVADNYLNTKVLEQQQQQSNAKDKWVHSVLTIPMFNQEPQLYYRSDDHITIPSPTIPVKSSEERFEISPSTEQALNEFGQVGYDQESTPYVGHPKQFPEGHVIQHPPNMVPRYEKHKIPIRHHHCINDDLFTEREWGLEHIVSQGIVGLSRLIRRHNRTLNPQEQLGTLLWPNANGPENNRGAPKGNQISNEAPGPDAVTAFNALVQSMNNL